MKSQNKSYLSEDETLYYMRQVRDGFKELREHKIIHRDFKMSNLLLHNNIVKIGDFGMAKKGYEIASTQVGSPLTSAPEVLVCDPDDFENSYYNSKSDLWSIGCVLY